MGLSVCPVAVVAAPVEVVWENLVQWGRYLEWADTWVERIEPEGPASVEDSLRRLKRASESQYQQAQKEGK